MSATTDRKSHGNPLTPPTTFMGVPFATDLGTNKAAILGIPFDCGTHPTRIGARYGPHAIREQSALNDAESTAFVCSSSAT